MNKNRFDLENEIMNLYGSVSDIQTVADMIYDSNINYTPDRTHTVLSGLAEVLEAKVAKLEQVFVEVFQLNEYAPEEVKEYRKQLAKTIAEMKENEDLVPAD
jgi:hypothetical protein